MKYFFVIVNICLLMAVLVGCGEDEESKAPDAEQFISEGWKEYSAGNYEDAIAKYEMVLDEDPSVAEACNGIGWAEARLGRVKNSVESFKKAVAKDPANADAHAGLAGAYLADGDYERAVASARQVLLLKPEYVSHHDDIKSADIRVLLAECYYNLGEYDSSKAQIDVLGGAGKSLDKTSPTYLADLLSLIADLSESW